jgi:hypothetical protein
LQLQETAAIAIASTITANVRNPSAIRNRRLSFLRLRFLFFGGWEEDPVRFGAFAVLRVVPVRDAEAERVDDAAFDAEAVVLRWFAKRSVPFAAENGSSALRFGADETLRAE